VTGDPVDCPDAFNCAQSFTLTYRIYNQELGGSSAWLEAHTNVPIYQGAFHSLLGANSPMTPEILGDEAWLSIEINGEGEMAPRQRVASAAFALRSDTATEATNAENLGGTPAIEYVTGPHTVDTTLSDEEVLSIVSGAGHVPGEHTTDTDTTLTEEQVDSMVANNGYAGQEDLDALLGSLATVASSADFSDLANVPLGLSDGDDDTVGALSCATGEVAQFNGATWACSNAASGVGTTEPAPCGAETVGRMYFDVDTNSLRLCDGTAYRKIKICSEICPPASTIACGLPVEDDCGSSCAELGTALNSNQCSAASTVLCGTPIADDCANSCGSGTALDESECDEVSTACGNAVLDTCGNACGITGTFCSSAEDKCADGGCVVACGDGVLDPGEECDDGNALDGDDCSSACSVTVDVTFTNCGKTGRSGPSQGGCNSAYLATSLEGAVAVSGGIQSWTVPFTGTYRISVSGAQGGEGSGSVGGLGSRMRGDFNLAEGTVLNLLVGQKGRKGPSCGGDCLGGGGGGSYVFVNATDPTPLIAAGGGGGANHSTNGDPAVITEDGANGTAETEGAGSNGNGGTNISCSSNSGSGAGWLSDASIKFNSCETTGTAPHAPRNNGEGGQGNDPSTQTGEGGFGGGGGSAVECGQTGGGGGGGYSGGGGSSCCSLVSCAGPGGGGGSYNSGSSQENSAGIHSAHGQITIQKL
jgi:cysteine-rich repeat protein